MAKFRRAFKRARTRIRAASRRIRSGQGTNAMTVALYAAGYGLARNKVQQLSSPLTSRIPTVGGVSGYSLAAGVTGYLLAKKGNGMVRRIGQAMLVSEAFAIGAQVGTQVMGGQSSTAGSLAYQYI